MNNRKSLEIKYAEKGAMGVYKIIKEKKNHYVISDILNFFKENNGININYIPLELLNAFVLVDDNDKNNIIFKFHTFILDTKLEIKKINYDERINKINEFMKKNGMKDVMVNPNKKQEKQKENQEKQEEKPENQKENQGKPEKKNQVLTKEYMKIISDNIGDLYVKFYEYLLKKDEIIAIEFIKPIKYLADQFNLKDIKRYIGKNKINSAITIQKYFKNKKTQPQLKEQLVIKKDIIKDNNDELVIIPLLKQSLDQIEQEQEVIIQPLDKIEQQEQQEQPVINGGYYKLKNKF